jgi:hypothetical protein
MSAAQQIVSARSSGARSVDDFKGVLKSSEAYKLDQGFKQLSTEKLRSAPELKGLKVDANYK